MTGRTTDFESAGEILGRLAAEHLRQQEAAPHKAGRAFDRRAFVIRGIGLGLALASAILVVQQFAFWLDTQWARDWAFGNGDLVGYTEGARRFLDTGSPYLPEQLAPWHLGPHSMIHPPIALALFVPFLWLPAFLWWAIPLGGTVALIAWAKPGPYRLAAILLCIAWPRSVGAILAGNSDIWAMFAAALGMRFGWGWALLAFKPTFAPLAVFGIRDRRTWIGGLAMGVACLAFGHLWLDYFTVVRGVPVNPFYSLGGLPLVMLPVLTWRVRRP